MSNPDDFRPGGVLRYSEAESHRFGYRVFRGDVTHVDAEGLREEVFRDRADIVILRIPSERQPDVDRLASIGCPLIVADTLVRWEVDLSTYEPAPSAGDGEDEIVGCATGELQTLKALVREVFANYVNHYSANPLLDRSAMLDGYEDWAVRYATGKVPGAQAWFVKRRGEVVAFITGSAVGGECECAIGGVLPSATGGGVYRMMIRHAQRFFKEMGCSRMRFATQVQNVAVQKVWGQEGFRHVGSSITVHLNCLLDKSIGPARHVEVVAMPDGALECPELVESPFRPESWRERGSLEETVVALASELFLEGSASRVATLETGGWRAFGPVGAGQRYTLRVSFPAVNGATSERRAVAQLTDGAGRLRMLVYGTLREVAT